MMHNALRHRCRRRNDIRILGVIKHQLTLLQRIVVGLISLRVLKLSGCLRDPHILVVAHVQGGLEAVLLVDQDLLLAFHDVAADN